MFLLDGHQSAGGELTIFLHLKSIPMSVIVILLVASISVAALFLGAFIWNIKSGQYDDEYGSSVRILFDDTTKETKIK
jgi:cbb3-type cytochrome oxidase maturation protein